MTLAVYCDVKSKLNQIKRFAVFCSISRVHITKLIVLEQNICEIQVCIVLLLLMILINFIYSLSVHESVLTKQTSHSIIKINTVLGNKDINTFNTVYYWQTWDSPLSPEVQWV